MEGPEEHTQQDMLPINCDSLLHQPRHVLGPPEDRAQIAYMIFTVKPAKSDGDGKGQLKFTVKVWGNR